MVANNVPRMAQARESVGHVMRYPSSSSTERILASTPRQFESALTGLFGVCHGGGS